MSHSSPVLDHFHFFSEKTLTQDHRFDLLLAFGVLTMDATHYSSKTLDHLGLVAGFCQDIGLADYFEQHMPTTSPQKKLSHGDCVVAMLLNGLGFTGRTLHMYPQYFASKPVARLLGKPVEAEAINDDVLGRCLDKLYEVGVSELYEGLASKVVNHLGLSCETVHLDATSIHVDGNYETEDDYQGIRLMRGYSRDNHPELNQVVLNLITENQAGLPVYMQACSGNSHDSESFKALVKSHIGSLKAAQQSRYFVGDASLYVAETIQTLEEQGQFFVTRVPQKLTAAKRWIQQQNDLDFSPMSEGYEGVWLDSNYADVKQKWLLVRSQQASQREHKTLQRQVIKSTQASLKSFKQLCRQSFRCETDAKAHLAHWIKKQNYVDVANVSFTTQLCYEQRGRPSTTAIGIKSYTIAGHLYTCLEKVKQQQEQKGLFILATNDCSEILEMTTLLHHYKSQQSVERGFRFLKSPDFLVSSLFLKKPERIEALLMIMTCCLMVYAALEHLIRTRLNQEDETVPDMKNKPTNTPTARWIFYCFIGIQELNVDQRILIINLKPMHKTILKCLGHRFQKIYS